MANKVKNRIVWHKNSRSGKVARYLFVLTTMLPFNPTSNGKIHQYPTQMNFDKYTEQYDRIRSGAKLPDIKKTN